MMLRLLGTRGLDGIIREGLTAKIGGATTDALI
jgi:hypothetical protein